MDLVDHWNYRDGGYWESGDHEIYLVDSFTPDECAAYDVPFDADAAFALYRVYTGKAPECVLISLHPDLKSAMLAGIEE